MKRIVYLLLCSVLLVSMMGLTIAENVETPIELVEIAPIKAIAISEVFELGQAISAVALEFPEEIPAGTAWPLIGISPFTAVGFDQGAYEMKNLAVASTYVNNSLDLYDAQETGKYLIVDFSDTLTAVANKTRLDSSIQLTWEEDIPVGSDKVIKAGSIRTTEDVSYLIDDFKLDTFTGSENRPFKYRLFVPEIKEGKKYPMFVFLHGGGEIGEDGFMHVSANASPIEFAKPASQAVNPCFVLAPQSPQGGWPIDGIKELIDNIMREYDAVDGARISLSGLSYGSGGTVSLMTKYPEMFAAAVPVAGGSFKIDAYDTIKDKSVWIIMAADESEGSVNNAKESVAAYEEKGHKVLYGTWNGLLRGEDSRIMAQKLIDEIEETGAKMILTFYIKGTTIFYPHLSWNATYSNEAFRDWLLSQAQEVPYEPAK